MIKQSKKIVTDAGTWRKIDYDDGARFREFKSHAEIMGRPLLCIATGKDPDTQRMAVAKGVIAIGQRASGTIAIGQFVNGTVSIGQFATGRLAAVGQFVVAPIGIGQFSLAVVAAAQIGIAGWALLQTGAVMFGGFGQQVFNVFQFLGL